MSKKSMAVYDFVYFIVRVFFVIMMLVSIYYVTRLYESKELDTAEIEAGLFMNYLLYSPNGLSYRDTYISRIYPGTIDPKNLNSTRLEKAADFGQPNNMVAANITLFDIEKKNVIAQALYNEKGYGDWFPIAFTTFFGRGSVLKAENETYVIYVDENNNTKSGVLKTEILVPRT